jgi:hypothetical protein
MFLDHDLHLKSGSYVSLYRLTKVQRGPYRKYACGICPPCLKKRKEEKTIGIDDDEIMGLR